MLGLDIQRSKESEALKIPGKRVFPVCIDFTRDSWSVTVSMIEMGSTLRSVSCAEPGYPDEQVKRSSYDFCAGIQQPFPYSGDWLRRSHKPLRD